jgi:hypothetical protein
MARLSETLTVSVVELQWPMERLRREGKVRSAGRRHLMRYFPTVVALEAPSPSVTSDG